MKKLEFTQRRSFLGGTKITAHIKGARAGRIVIHQKGKLGMLGLLRVRTKFRKQGIGTKLIEEAVKNLGKKKAREIRVEIMPLSDQKFVDKMLKKQGFKRQDAKGSGLLTYVRK